MSQTAIHLDDYRVAAAEVLDAGACAYIDGGAGDEHTVSANARAWASLPLRPRLMRDMRGGHTRVDLLGRTLTHPILLAPVALQRVAHPDGEHASAVAASAQGAGYVLSLQSSCPLESVARLVRDDAHRGPLWYQVVMLHDRGYLLELVARAERAGFEALVLTADSAVQGARDRQRTALFKLPVGVSAVDLADLPPRPLRRGSAFDQFANGAPTWDDLAWLASHTRLPVLLKGVLRGDDALHAVGEGAAGLIVSNHGGRTLDGALATADALPRVVEAAADRVPVLVDGGIRRGVDVLRACALGARAVLVGRPQVHALAAAGARGVAHMIRLLRDELEMVAGVAPK